MNRRNFILSSAMTSALPALKPLALVAELAAPLSHAAILAKLMRNAMAVPFTPMDPLYPAGNPDALIALARSTAQMERYANSNGLKITIT